MIMHFLLGLEIDKFFNAVSCQLWLIQELCYWKLIEKENLGCELRH